MGSLTSHPPVLFISAAFSRYDEALAWAREKLVAAYGPVALVSDAFVFDQTAYYERSMGKELKKVFFAFEKLIDPASLAKRKLQTNDWEQEYAALGRHGEQRPLNLDPGYLTEAKLVLATTKDRQHRIYLGQGIFAEVTLSYHRGGWRFHDWTYPDYQTQGYHEFFLACRDYLRKKPYTEERPHNS